MNKYRSIDTAWEQDELLIVGEPCNGNNHCSKFDLTINGQKVIGIFYITGPIIPEYFTSIKFTGHVTAKSIQGCRTYDYDFADGVILGDILVKTNE
jgi:hypothetical protein